MIDFLREADQLQTELVAIRRQLHQNAETGMDLPLTSAVVITKLKEMGYEPEISGVSGVSAVIGDKSRGKCFLLRADMDALPFAEQADVAFKSENGNMHACGHDLHTTMLLGAAKLLKAHESEIDGCVKLMFQPDEENLQGAQAMIKDGILKHPTVDAAAMIHVFSGTDVPSQTIIVPPPGPTSAARDWFTVNLKMRGESGYLSNMGDPLAAISQLRTAIESIKNNLPNKHSATFTINSFNADRGTTPPWGMLKGNICSTDTQLRQQILDGIRAHTKSVAEAFNAEESVEVEVKIQSVMVDAEVSETALQALADGAFEKIEYDHPILMIWKMASSEDFALVAKEVPSVMMMISAGSVQEGFQYTLHNPKVILDESVLSLGAAVYAATAYAWLSKN